MSNQIDYSAAIIGGGLAGMTLACLLGRAGVSTLCIDRASDNAGPEYDLRTTAVSYGSQQILEQAGIWSNLPADPCPINNIEIFDGHSPMLLNFLSDEVEGNAFGWIVLNSDLRAAMRATLSTFDSVIYLPETRATLSSVNQDRTILALERTGEEPLPIKKDVSAALLIGADGRASTVRDWMGVRTRQRNYNQRAVICTVAHEHPHENKAVEHFWPQGPFAVLPMADGSAAPDGKKGEHRSSVVFTEHGPEERSLMKMSDEAFELALANKFPARYGDIEVRGKRACYPLGLIHASDYIAPRMALVADAAHGIHPIAGQGLNLGFRDVDTLAKLVNTAYSAGTDIGAPKILQAYQRARRIDNTAMVAVTDGLNRLFSNNIMPVRVARKIGLRAVAKLPIAKRFFMRQAMGDR